MKLRTEFEDEYRSLAMAKVKRGPAMPDSEADAWADRFESLSPKDLGRGRPGPGYRGRPPLSGVKKGAPRPPGHSPKVQARVPKPLYDKLTRRARDGRTSVSAVLREAIEKL